MADALSDFKAVDTAFRAGQRYPSPFFDIGSLFIPPRLKDLFKFCQLYAFSDEIVSATVYKLAQFPITDIVYDTKNENLKSRWRKILEEDLGMRTRLEEAGLDYHTYGNYIASFYVPFVRFLMCPSCKNQRPIKGTRFDFRVKDFRFYMKCSKCSPNESIPMQVIDKPITKTTAGMNIVRWDPAQIDIEYNPISGGSTYYYNLPNQFKRHIYSGRRKVLEETPMSFIMAAKEGARVELDSNNIIHIRRPSFSYFDNGWGMPLIVPLLKSRYYYQTLLKAREALYLQHITPLWMLYPLPQANLDPHAHLSMAKWRQEIDAAVKKWKRDPNYIAIFPIPTGFQQIGGDARALSVIDEMRFMQETMIVGLQVPKEFLIGGMSWSGSSVTFRMVENFFLNHIRGLKQLMQFVIDKVHKATKLEKIDTSMTRLKWVDDVQQKSLIFQANQAGKVSDETLVGEIGYSMAKEFEKMMAEVEKRGELQKKQMKAQAEAEGEAMVAQVRYQTKAAMEQAKAQRDMMAELQAQGWSPEEAQALAMASQVQHGGSGSQFKPGGILNREPNKSGTGAGGGPMPGPGAAVGAMPGAGGDPEMWAGSFASTLQQMDPAQRDQHLMRLQVQNPQVHAMVTKKIMENNGIDARPNPEKGPPRRNAGKAPTPSKLN